MPSRWSRRKSSITKSRELLRLDAPDSPFTRTLAAHFHRRRRYLLRNRELTIERWSGRDPHISDDELPEVLCGCSA